MQIPEKRSSNNTLKVVLIIVVVACILLWGRKQLNAMSHAVEVNRDELLIATVNKGNLLREIRAAGTIVPVASNFLAATSNGRVKAIRLQASEAVDVGSVIMELENPQLTQQVAEATLDVDVQQYAYQALAQNWQQKLLKQRIVVADFQARYEMIKLRREANAQLVSTGAVSNIDFQESKLREQQLKFQHQLEVELLERLPLLQQAELDAASAKVNKAIQQLSLLQKLSDDLLVKARSKGVIQEVALKVGEPVNVGTVLARIAGQNNLKVELRVQESQAKDVIKGQNVVLSAGGNKAQGTVKRIHPAVTNGAVLVEVYFNDDLLVGARPDLRVDGVIELSQVTNVLTLKRPVFSQEFSSGSLFVLDKNYQIALRRQVTFGSSSVDLIEIRSALKEGDQVIVSSMKKFNDVEQVYIR